MIYFIIPLQPISKKNSQRIMTRWGIDKKTGRRKKIPYIAPSEQYEKYERNALFFIPRIETITEPVNVKCLFYMGTRRKCDLTNMLEAIDDILVHAGVLADDNYTIVAGHDGSRIYYDKENPRTEIYIEGMSEIE